MKDIQIDKQGIILVDKPKGVSSFDVIRVLRKDLGIRKMGHAGTLDPLASGLLIIGVGEGTKKMEKFLKLPKVYEVEVLLGTRTTTGDMEGDIIEKSNVKYSNVRHPVFNMLNILFKPFRSNVNVRHPVLNVSVERIQEVLKGLVGTIMLPVPVYSAIKQNGEPLYKKARRGESVVPPVREMEIRRISLREIRRAPALAFGRAQALAFGRAPALAFGGQEGKGIVLDIEIDVGSGTYIRSIAEEIGRRLGIPATVKELRRTRIGDFKVENAQKVQFSHRLST